MPATASMGNPNSAIFSDFTVFQIKGHKKNFYWPVTVLNSGQRTKEDIVNIAQQ